MPKLVLLTGELTSFKQSLVNSLIAKAMIPFNDVIIRQYVSEVSSANLLVTFGNSLLSLFSNENLSDVRGTVIEGNYQGKFLKIIPTLDLDDLVMDLSNEIIFRADLIKARREMEFPETRFPRWILKENPSFSEAMEQLEKLQKATSVAFDLETCTKTQQIICIGLASSSEEGMSIPFSRKGESVWSISEEIALWQKIQEFFSSPVKKIAHNACFDVASLWHNNRIWVNNLWFDTMLAWHVLYHPSSGKNVFFKKDLGFIASMVLNVPAWKHKSNENLAVYNIKDTCITWSLAQELDKALDSRNRTTFELEMKEIEPAIFLSLRGIKVNLSEKDSIFNEISQRLFEIEKNLREILSTKYGVVNEVNYRSPKQLSQLLYVTLGLPIQFKRGSNKVTTDEESLDKLYRKTQNEVLGLILEHREVSKALSFCDMKPSAEGRVHTSYNIAGTSSGRWSSSENIILPYGSGNLQQIPSRGKPSIIRKMYCVDNPENWIIQADFVQAEAVIVAYLIGDENLKEAFRRKADIHKVTAAMMFNLKIEDVSPEQREIGKMIRHATNYSLGANGLAAVLKCEVSIAKRYLELFHNSCPQLRRWQESIQQKLKADRTLTTPFGRSKIFLGRFDDSMYRSAYSFIPQSTIGDLLNKSLLRFYESHGNEYSLWLQLHDAMYIDDVPESKIQDCLDKMKSCMYWEIPINGETCIIDVDFKKGKNWKEMEKIK